MAPVAFLVTRVESIIYEVSGYMKKVEGFYHYKGTKKSDFSSRKCRPSTKRRPSLMEDVKNVSLLS